MLTDLLTQHHFKPTAFSSLKAFTEAVKVSPPQVIIIDMHFPDDECGGSNCIQELREYLREDTTIIFASAHTEMESRLAAVRAGATHYFPKPLDTNKLITLLDDLTDRIPSEPYRILVIDDDTTMSDYCKTVLSSANMAVSIVNEPFLALEIINKTQPELILLDLYMPGCSGMELAKVIRLDDRLANTAIIFLSSETRLEKQLSAMNLGGDDFITKPIDAEVLVNTVTAKVKRARQVNQLMKDMHSVMRENEYQRQAMDQHAIVSMTDTQGNIFYVNERFTEVNGYTREEVLGKNHRILKSGLHPDSFYEEMWSTISQGKIWQGEVCNRAKDGHHYWVESSIIPFLDDDGLPYQYISVRTDITTLIEAEAARSRQRKELQTILDSVPAMIWYKDKNNNILRCNKEAADVVGLKAKEIVDCNACDIYPENSDVFYQGDLEVIRTGEPKRNSIETLTTPDGKEHWLSVDRIPYYDDEGKLFGVIVFAIDITLRKEAEEALSESEERLKMSQNFANIGTWDWNITTGDLFWSEKIAPLFGYTEEKVETTYDNFLAAIHPEDRDQVVEAVNNCVEKGAEYNIEHRVVWQDGTERWLLEKGDVVRDEQGQPLHMLGVVQDITNRKSLEQTLADQKILLMMLRHATTRFMTTSSFTEAADFLLEGLLSLTHSEYGFTGEILYDESNSPYLHTHSIEAPAGVMEALGASSENNSIDIKELDNLFGHTVMTGEVLLTNSPNEDPRMGDMFRELKPVSSYLGVPVHYGNQLVGMYAICNRENGYDESLIDFLRPFTATLGVLIWSKRNADSEYRRQQELVKAKEDAERANKAKSTFLSNMSHELRTPMNAILGFGQLLESEVDDSLSDDQKDSVTEIIKAGNHLLSLINEVLDLSRIESGHIDLSLEAVDLDDILYETLSLIQPLADKRQIQISYDDESFEHVIHADRTRVKQVMINLLSNAIKYNVDNGTIALACAAEDSGMLSITITDTGIGISEEDLAELFKPFSRVGAEKTHIEGTGIGLVLTQHLIELMGGTISLNSELHKGTSVTIQLPIQHDTEGTQQENEEEEEISAATTSSDDITMLYVEDNPVNMKLVANLMAKRTEIHLITAHDGPTGIEMALQQKPQIILLDINLGEMSGIDILKTLRQHAHFANTPIIALSANAMQEDIETAMDAGFNDYLTKPINIQQFMQTLDNNIAKLQTHK